MEQMKRLFILRYATGTITDAAIETIKSSLPADTVFVPVEYKASAGSPIPTVEFH